MRLRASLRVVLFAAEGRTDNPMYFWRELTAKARGDSSLDDEGLGYEYDRRLRLHFTDEMEHFLRQKIPDITIILRDITYSSLNLDLDLVTRSLGAIGLTPNDLFDMLRQYTPFAITEAVGIPSSPAPWLMVQVTGQVVEGEPSTGIAQSLMGNAWWVANTSLVLPAVIFLAAAYLLFNSANSERARVNETILKQLSEHAEQRQKAFDRYDALLKSVEDNLTAQFRHFRDLYQLEAEMMKARLEQVKNQPSGAGQAR